MLKNLTATCGWQQRLRQLYEAGMSNMPISLRRKQAGEESNSLRPFPGRGRIQTQTSLCRARPPQGPVTCVSWSLPGSSSDSPEGLPALGETETMMEASRASMLLFARHTYSPESATDI